MSKRVINKSAIRDINIIDIILIDHRFMKDCIEILLDEKSPKNLKLGLAKGFLLAIKKHADAEKKIIYSVLKDQKEFHFKVLESEIEHGIVEEKIKMLKPQISRAKVLTDEIAAELKVLAELVKHHLKEEESDLLPNMNQWLDEETLKKMGEDFMKLRKMTTADLENYPQLQEELVSWKDDVQKISSQFLSKMDKYVESLKH